MPSGRTVPKSLRTIASCQGRNSNGSPLKSPVWDKRFINRTARSPGSSGDAEEVAPRVVGLRFATGHRRISGRGRAEAEVVDDRLEPQRGRVDDGARRIG